ncbi:hypothetical protein Bhyg_04679 [Pseudolycoriella hygida]|uniref:Ribosomal RNA methyltransferase FtsJ domain-containing protein n=1 Tax=Pseudolycoriella hygida TaxID=35572 RepID=A0A9Q0NH83_9DIPT|nr:hypothetical protein Bhyg_04679 [Pseudolycoriella hygida]
MEDARIVDFLSQRSSIYIELKKLQKEVWENPKADKYFHSMQNNADTATPQSRAYFRKLMANIATEMDEATQFLTDIEVHRQSKARSQPPKVLDLCMAPGGFSGQVRQSLCPLTEINGITLPLSLGGHELLVKTGPRLKVEFLDITMLAAEMGYTITDIPPDHPDHNLFLFDRPFFNQTFDLILCDGQVLRTHKRQEHRGEKLEPLRLCVSQLVFALQHIKAGGTFTILLHNADYLRTLKIIYSFSKFSSSVQLFKPTAGHKQRSSFYLVAKGVNPQSPFALNVVSEWKKAWTSSTLHFSTWKEEQTSNDEVDQILAEFGEKLIQMCEPMWKIQCEALCRLINSGFQIFEKKK